MQMPTDLIEKMVAESHGDSSFTSVDSGTDDVLSALATTSRKVAPGPPEVWEFTARDAGAALIEAGRWLSCRQGTDEERDVEGADWSSSPHPTLRLTLPRHLT